MYKIFLTIMFTTLLHAELVSGIAIVVEGEPITLYELKQEMKNSKLDVKGATDILVRKKLEAAEIKKRKISVDSSEVYSDIKKTAAKNNMNVSQFYEAVRNSNGLSSSELKEKIKEKLLSQKLYSSIAYSSAYEPTDEEALEYFELHKNDFLHPSAFKVTIYTAKDKELLKKKISNPMFYSPNIMENKQRLVYEQISPDLANFLEQAEVNRFTPIVPDAKGSFMSFYLREIEDSQESSFESAKNKIMNILMGNKREQVLSDYFARLKTNADIKTIRVPE